MTEQELENLVDLLMKELSVSDTTSEVGKVAREYVEAIAIEKKLMEQEFILILTSTNSLCHFELYHLNG